MSGSIEDYDGLCGVIAGFSLPNLQLRCQYSFGHNGPCSWEKYGEQFKIKLQSYCNSSCEEKILDKKID